MSVLFGLVAGALGVVSIVCWILVLIKMFTHEGPLYGILGIICSIYALIWGWMNADRYNIRNIVTIWTVAAIGGLVLNLLIAPMFN
ncbi:MAG: hypothetical protein SF339_30275 [Blastocatellia bacterium]|nr:hypothetical protein [Blastocatellia bacterium]